MVIRMTVGRTHDRSTLTQPLRDCQPAQYNKFVVETVTCVLLLGLGVIATKSITLIYAEGRVFLL